MPINCVDRLHLTLVAAVSSRTEFILPGAMCAAHSNCTYRRRRCGSGRLRRRRRSYCHIASQILSRFSKM